MQIGFYKLRLPVQYLEDSADEGRRKAGEIYIQKFKDMLEGKSSGIVFPALTDSDGNRMFDIEYVGPSTVTTNIISND